MQVRAIRSDEVYAKMATGPREKRDDLYRYELMAPFKKKWDCYHVPLKAAQKQGYDVVMASEMLGIRTPSNIDETCQSEIRLLADDDFWKTCQDAIERSLDCFVQRGIDVPVKDYLFTVLLADSENPVVMANGGYSGDGGIPGYLFAWLVPTQAVMRHLPAALAHEANHNVRFQFIAWRNDITLGEMMVSEGLAENFAAHLFGEGCVGPWVSKTSPELLQRIKPCLHEALDVQGMASLSAYLYGDETAVLQGYSPVGMPYCAGYACGYYLVRHFLDVTGTNIVDATLLPAEVILEQASSFWV